MSWNIVENGWMGNRELFRVKRASVQTSDAPGEREIVLMHGWHSLYQPLLPLEAALRARFPQARLWRVNYDSHWKTFARSGREVVKILRYHQVRPEDTLLIGYSMGGLVARSMVASGFDARAVVCLASPHLGPVSWLPVGDVGSYSMAPWGKTLRALNSNPRDIARRGDYFFQAFTFDDIGGTYRHDHIVPLRSASGQGLKGVGARNIKHLHYQGIASPSDPHLQGMNPACLCEMFDWCAQKLA